MKLLAVYEFIGVLRKLVDVFMFLGRKSMAITDTSMGEATFV